MSISEYQRESFHGSVPVAKEFGFLLGPRSIQSGVLGHPTSAGVCALNSMGEWLSIPTILELELEQNNHQLPLHIKQCSMSHCGPLYCGPQLGLRLNSLSSLIMKNPTTKDTNSG